MVLDPAVYAPDFEPSLSRGHFRLCYIDRRDDRDMGFVYDEPGDEFWSRHYTALFDIMEEDVFVNHLTLNDEMEDVLHSLNEGFATLRPTLTRA